MAAPLPNGLAKQIAADLGGDMEGKDDWTECGDGVCDCLESCLSQLERGQVVSRTCCEEIAQIWRMCQDEINKVHHTKVHRKWRRLYTDTCILQGAIALLGDRNDESRESIVLDTIRALDMALIVCGAPGSDRLDLVHTLIRTLQIELPPIITSPSGNDGSDEDRLDDQVTCLASAAIKECPSLPAFSHQPSLCHPEPFIVRSYAADWPALQDGKRQWREGAYLERVAGPGRVVPVEIGWQYTDTDWHQAIVSWTDFLKTSGWSSSVASAASTTTAKGEKVKDKSGPVYLAQHNLFTQFPALEADIILPDILYSCPPPPLDFEQYKAPMDEDGLETAVINAWIGPVGTTTPAHFDPYYNAYVQVVGHKLIWIAPPGLLLHHGLLHGNSSSLAIFDPDKDTERKHATVREQAMHATLAPGDLLFLPPGWSHGMRSLSRSISVSMWF